MSNQPKCILSVLCILVLTLLLLPLLANAQAGQPGTTITIPNPLGENTDIIEILKRITDFLLTVAVPIAVLVIIVAGILFMTAGDNQQRLEQAKKALFWAVLGIVILLLSKGIVVIVEAVLKGT